MFVVFLFSTVHANIVLHSQMICQVSALIILNQAQRVHSVNHTQRISLSRSVVAITSVTKCNLFLSPPGVYSQDTQVEMGSRGNRASLQEHFWIIFALESWWLLLLLEEKLQQERPDSGKNPAAQSGKRPIRVKGCTCCQSSVLCLQLAHCKGIGHRRPKAMATYCKLGNPQ